MSISKSGPVSLLASSQTFLRYGTAGSQDEWMWLVSMTFRDKTPVGALGPGQVRDKVTAISSHPTLVERDFPA